MKITEEDIMDFLDYLKGNDKSSNTISKYKRDSRMYANKIPNVMVETALMILDFTHFSFKKLVVLSCCCT